MIYRLLTLVSHHSVSGQTQKLHLCKVLKKHTKSVNFKTHTEDFDLTTKSSAETVGREPMV